MENGDPGSSQETHLIGPNIESTNKHKCSARGWGGMKGTKLWLILTSQFPHTEFRMKGPKMLANRQRVPKLKISV